MSNDPEVGRAYAALLDLNRETQLSIKALDDLARALGWTVEYTVNIVEPTDHE